MSTFIKTFLRKQKLKKELKTLKKQTKNTLLYDDDILRVETKEKLEELGEGLNKISFSDIQTAEEKIKNCSDRFAKVRPSKSFKVVREYIEIIVVALTVAFGIRALYLQPFKIPTSSMQPTLFGIHYINKDVIPNLPQPLSYGLFSTRKADLKIKKSGDFEGFYPDLNKYFFFSETSFNIGGKKYELPGKTNVVNGYAFNNLAGRTTLGFNKGSHLLNGWLSLGDHLFVNRMIYHFENPHRGDIVVFTTEGLKEDATGEPLIKEGLYYVKRLVGLPGDTMKISSGMLYIKPKGATAFKAVTNFGVKAFERIYSGEGGYQGYFPVGRLAKGKEVHVPPHSYFMLGDNSLFSADSRYWGFVPRKNIVGKALFIFWPFSRRWGFTDDTSPVPVPTKIINNSGIPSIPTMRLQ